MSYKVLEIYCFGGLSIWETFWVTKSSKGSSKIDWRGFDAEMDGLNWRGVPNDKFPTSSHDIGFFGDAVGPESTAVYWGPATKPLRKLGLMKHTRLVTLQHRDHFENPPFPEKPGNDENRSDECKDKLARRRLIVPCRHPFASALAATGKATTSSNGVGLGFAVQQHNDETDSAFIFLPNFVHANANCLLFNAFYLSQLNKYGQFQPSYIPKMFTEQTKESVQVVSSKDNHFEERPDTTTPSLKAAASLLARPATRYVAVFDLGLQLNGVKWSGYDTHPHNTPEIKTHPELTNNNLHNLLLSLTDLIERRAIDLNSTMIRINLEWTRTPWKEQHLLCGCCRNQDNLNDSTGAKMNVPGRNHYPYAYVNLFIGGPAYDRGPAIVGSFEEHSMQGTGINCGVVNDVHREGPKGKPVHSPTELYAATLKVMGVDPFKHVFGSQDENLLQKQFPCSWSGDAEATADNLVERVFELPPDAIEFDTKCMSYYYP